MVSVIDDECIGCETCVDICPVEAIEMEDGLAKIDEDECVDCLTCIDECPVEAIAEE